MQQPEAQYGGWNRVRRTFGRPVGTVILAAVLVAALVAPSTSAFAVVSNAQIRAKQAEARDANQKLLDLNDDLELKQTELQAIEEALNVTREEIVETEARLSQAEATLQESEDRLAQRVEAIYRNGSISILDVLVGVSDFNDFVSRLDMLNRIESADAELVEQVEADRDRVAQARTSLVNRETEQVALRAEAEIRKSEVQAAVDRQKEYVSSLSRDIKRLIDQEERRRERAAAEAARRAAELANKPDVRDSDVGELGSPHPAAATTAKRYLGVRYVWGGTSPSGFDCSGLTQYVYAKIGISIPRTSRTQFTVGKFIPRTRTDMLEPGDLVFFGYGGDATKIHHVGIYVGGGVFIHAPGTGDYVKYSSLTDRISTRRDYVGAVRP